MRGSSTIFRAMMRGSIAMLCELQFRLRMEIDVANEKSFRADVFARDLFETKFEGDLMNGEEGRRYRLMILEMGRSEREEEMLEKYLGRKPNGAAFSRALRK